MRRSLIAGLMLVAACGGAGTAPVTTDPGVIETSTTTVTSAPAESPTTGAPVAAPSRDGLEPAPDFVVTLGEGGTFSLSDEQKPVYLVFWAEW